MGASKGTYDKVLELLGNISTKKILDCGAGKGRVTALLISKQAEVYACDLNDKDFTLNIPFKKVDLNKKLPYPDNTFDKIICIEVIEHLENPFHLLRELKRILVKGGQLILTTPNMENIKSRFQFLFGANLHWFQESEFGDKGSRHINPLSFKELNFIFNKTGFKLIRFTTNRYRGYTFYISENSNITKKILFTTLNFACDLFYSLFSILCSPSNKVLKKGDILIFDLKKV